MVLPLPQSKIQSARFLAANRKMHLCLQSCVFKVTAEFGRKSLQCRLKLHSLTSASRQHSFASHEKPDQKIHRSHWRDSVWFQWLWLRSYKSRHRPLMYGKMVVCKFWPYLGTGCLWGLYEQPQSVSALFELPVETKKWCRKSQHFCPAILKSMMLQEGVEHDR